MDFYFGRMSGNSTRVAFCLGEVGASYAPHLLDVKKAENRSPAYLKVNPMGKIPALVDGSFTLWESNAINWYLAEKFPQAGLLPGTIEGRADVHRWLFFQAAHVSPACVPVYRASNKEVQEAWGAGDPKAAANGAKELARYLPVIEERLGEGEWLAGGYSLADLAYAPHLHFLEGGGFDFSPYPRLRQWLDRLFARPAWIAARDLILG